MPRTLTSNAALRVLVALQQPQRGGQEHPVGALERGIEDVRLTDVPAGFKDLDPRIGERGAQVLAGAADKVVVDDDFGHALMEQCFHGASRSAPPADCHYAFVDDIH